MKSTQVLCFDKGPNEEMDEDELKSQIEQVARAFMDASKKNTSYMVTKLVLDFLLWKLVLGWTTASDGSETAVFLYRCPLKGQLRCNAELKIYDASFYQMLETQGEHNDYSHHPSKDRSKLLKVKQLDAIHTGVSI